MNRIILIGNGFDLAHGLKTGYRDFMCGYWREFAQKYPETKGGMPYEDDFIKLENTNGPKGGFDACEGATYLGDAKCKAFMLFVEKVSEITSYNDLMRLITEAKETAGLIYNLTFKNSFWEHLAKASALNTWLDIENEYYEMLKRFLPPAKNRNRAIRSVNTEFRQVKKLLEKYLMAECGRKIGRIRDVEDIIKSPISPEDCALSKENLFPINDLAQKSHNVIIREGIDPALTYLLNFNYTNTARLYEKCVHGIIDIHGQLNDYDNPIIFGYGDD